MDDLVIVIITPDPANTRLRFYVNDMDGDYPVVTCNPTKVAAHTKARAQLIRQRICHPSGNFYAPFEMVNFAAAPQSLEE